MGRGEWSESILGDLHEEYRHYAELTGSGGGLRAGAWYWAQSLRLAGRSLFERRRRTAIHDSRPGPIHDSRPGPVFDAPAGDSLMQTLGLELRYACRSILKRPATSAIIVVTLALGLGANAAVFSNIDSLVLRPFTMRDADRVTLLSYSKSDDLDRRASVSPADFLDMRRQEGVFEHFAAFEWWTANLVGKDEPENVQGFYVTSDFFAVMGLEPAAGRMFLPEDETIGQHRRVVLGHGLWQRRFASDPSIVGRAIEIDGQQYDVIGIAPPAFDFPMGSQLWAPMTFDAEKSANRRSLYITPIGRLAPGRTLDDAKAQMAVVGERLTRDHPDTNRGRELRVYSLSQGMRDIGLGPILSMWQASAALVLLIACANVASLLLARGAERRREMAVRLAIGASRARVVRELLMESTLLAMVAVPGALAVAWLALKLMVGYMPAKIANYVAGWYQMGVDLRLISFTVALALLAALIFGIIPAFQASRPPLTETLKEGGRTSTAGGARLRLRRGLVMAQMALALPLLVAAALAIVTVQRFVSGPQGFNPDGVLTMRLELPDARYPTADTRRRFADDALAHLRAIAGVESAAAANVTPAADNNWGRSIEIEGTPNTDPANPPSVDYRAATPDMFSTLQIPIRSGRGITDADRESTQPVVVVSESLARKYWPDQDPIGKRLRFGNDPWMTVVGVCGDVIHNWFGRRNYPTLYRPFRQAPTTTMALIVRTSREPESLAAEARAAVRAADPSQPVFDLVSMRHALHDRTIGLHYLGALMLVFGGLALLLAVLGVYGVMANMVAQRTHEIGVRMALGATSKDVLQLAVGQTGRLTAVGVAIGLALSFLLQRLIEAGLLGVASSDARITVSIAAILAVSALAAGYLPARRAAAIDPTVALRGE